MLGNHLPSGFVSAEVFMAGFSAGFGRRRFPGVGPKAGLMDSHGPVRDVRVRFTGDPTAPSGES